MTERRRQLLAVTLILIAVAAAWAPLAGRQAHSDDLRLLERIERIDAPRDLFPGAFSAPYPLAALLLRAERSVGGDAALRTMLATSLALQVAAILLLLALLRARGLPAGAAALFAAAWALHPIQVENLARPAAQGELLAVILVLAGVNFGQRLRPGIALEFALLACLVLGTAASPSGLLLPVALIALAPDPKATAVARLPLLVAAGLLAALLIARTPDGIAAARAWPWRVHDFLSAIALSFRDLAGPWALSPMHVVPSPLPPWAPPVVIGVAGACLWAGARRVADARRGVVWLAVALAFAAARGTRSLEYRADGWLALALAGLVWAAFARFGRPGRAPRTVAFVVIGVWGLLAHAQARIWSDERTLLDHAIAVRPDDWAARIARAELAMDGGDTDAMQRDAVAALVARPTAEAAVYLLGYARGIEGDRYALDRLGRFGPTVDRDDPALRLGYLFLDIGLTGGAIQLLRQARDAGEAEAGLALAWARSGDPARARLHLERALQREPHSAEGRLALAWLLATAPERELHDPGRALAAARLVDDPALQWRRADAEAAALAGMERFADAWRLAQDAVRGAEADDATARAEEIRARALVYLGGEAWTEGRGSGPAAHGGVDEQGDEHDDRGGDPGHR